MPISVVCGCGKHWQVHDSFAGQTALCPACGEEVTVPPYEGSEPPAAAYVPSSLPIVTAVDVIPLGGVDPDDASDYLQDPAARPGVRAEGDAARGLADLWRQLSPGVVMSCHLPAFGVRFRDGAGVICRASICWTCNSIRGDVGGEAFEYSFDAWDPAGMALFAELQRIAGSPPGT
jgi:hypothetical protein